MRKYVFTASAIVLMPTLSACSFLSQGGHDYHKGHHAPQVTQYQHHSNYHQADAVHSQSNLWCSDAGCAPESTYSVSHQPAAYYGTPTQPSAHAYGTQVSHYGHGPKLRGAHKAPQESYFYGNLGVVSYDLDNDLIGLQTRVGYQSANLWGVEVEGSMGLDEDNVDSPLTSTTTRLDVDYSVGAFALARLPLHDRLSVHARGGYHTTKISSDVDDGTTITELSNEFDGFAYGAGAEFNVTPKDSLRVDYTRYEGEGSDLDSISLGYARKF